MPNSGSGPKVGSSPHPNEDPSLLRDQGQPFDHALLENGGENGPVCLPDDYEEGDPLAQIFFSDQIGRGGFETRPYNLWTCTNDIYDFADQHFVGPQLTAEDFELPKIPNAGSSGPHSEWTDTLFDVLRKYGPPPETIVPSENHDSALPVRVSSFSTVVEIQTEDPIEVHLEIPYWFDYLIQIDLGTLSLPLEIRDDKVLINSGTVIETKGASLKLMLDSPYQWVRNSYYEIPIKGIYLDNGHPVLLFEVPNAYSSFIPDFADRFFSEVLQEGVDIFVAGQMWPFESYDSILFYKLGSELHKVPALKQFTDEEGAIKEEIELEDLMSLSPEMRELYNEGKIVQRKADAETEVPDEETEVPDEEESTTGTKIIRWFAEHVNVDTTIHTTAKVSDINSEFWVKTGDDTQDAFVQISNGDLFFDWDAPGFYELRGKIPLTELSFQPPGREENVFVRGIIEFRFNTNDKTLWLEFPAIVEGFDVVEGGTVQLAAHFPNWEPDKIDPDSMLEEMVSLALAEWLSSDGALTRALIDVGAGLKPAPTGSLEVHVTGNHFDESNDRVAAVYDLGIDIAPTLDSVNTLPFHIEAQTRQGSGDTDVDHLVLTYDQKEKKVTADADLSDGLFYKPGSGASARFESVQLEAELSGLEGFDLKKGNAVVEVDLSGSHVRLKQKDKSYRLTYSGHVRIEKDLADKSTPVNRVKLLGSFAAYDYGRGDRPVAPTETDALLAIINRGEISLRLDRLDWNQAEGRPDRLVGVLEVDLSEVKAERFIETLSPENKDLVRKWLMDERREDERIKLEWEFDVKPREITIDPLTPLGFVEGIDPESIEDSFAIPSTDSVSDFDMSGIESPMDLILPIAESFLASQQGLVTTTKHFDNYDDYDREYYLRWEGAKPCRRDRRRNKWVRQNQRRMRRHDEGFLVYGGKKGVYYTKSGALDFKFKKETRLDFWITHKKENPSDDFGSIRSVDMLFSKTICARVLGFLPVLGINGIFVDIEEGTILVDISPWPDTWSKKTMTEVVWKGTPEELQELLVQKGFDERFPADLEVWFEILAELDLQEVAERIGEDEIPGLPEEGEDTDEVDPEDEEPAEEPVGELKKNALNGTPFLAPEDIGSFHIDVKFDDTREVDFGFAKIRLECLGDACPFDRKHDNPDLNRLIADIDVNNKTVRLDFPFVERLIIESGDQQVILEEGSAQGLVFKLDDDGVYSLEADLLGIRTFQFVDRSEEGPSYILSSSEMNTFSNLIGYMVQDEEGKYQMGIELDFDTAEQLEVHIIHKEKDKLSGTERIVERYVYLDDADKVKGHMSSSLSIATGGEGLGDIDLDAWGIDLDIPQALITLGAAEKEKDMIQRQSRQRHRHKIDEEGHDDGFEVTFTLSDGSARIGYEKDEANPDDTRPSAAFSGHVHMDTDTPFKSEQVLAPGVTVTLQSTRIFSDFFGELKLDGDRVSVKPLPASEGVAPEPISMEIVGAGELVVNSEAMLGEDGSSLLPDAAPDFNWTAQFDEATIGTSVNGIEIILKPDPKSPGDVKPQLSQLELVDSKVEIRGGRSDFIIYSGKLELGRNRWENVGGSTVQVSNFDVSMMTDQDFSAGGLFSFNLADQYSPNHLRGRFDFTEGKEDEAPYLDISLADPYGENQLDLTFGSK